MIHIIQNHSAVPAGIFGETLTEMGSPFRTMHPYAGEVLPDPAGAAGVIVLGGYMGAYDEEQHPFLGALKAYMRRAVAAETPLLGICLGGQLLAQILGGEVRSNHRGEKGMQAIRLTAAGQSDPLFAGLPEVFSAFEWHNDSFDVPAGAVHLANSDACPGQAFRCRNAWGLQFHPEVDRAIVAAWSAAVDPEGRHAAAFVAGEAAHRAMARRLMENFLALAGSACEKPPRFSKPRRFGP